MALCSIIKPLLIRGKQNALHWAADRTEGKVSPGWSRFGELVLRWRSRMEGQVSRSSPSTWVFVSSTQLELSRKREPHPHQRNVLHQVSL